MTDRRIGLARALSKLGYCSRSQAFTLIRAGKIAVNGRVTRDPESPIKEATDRITVDGKPVATAQKRYLMLNKPRAIVTTASDEKGRDTVYSLLPPELPWVAPVGRLDKASEGLLLLTNDSEWAARVTSPESHVPKTYHVQIEAVADEALLHSVSSGIRSRTELLGLKRASILRGGEKNTWLQIVLEEGRNRQIRRMFETLGIEVLRLVRVAIGPLQLGKLAKGEVRDLTAAEKESIDALFQARRATGRT
ncbi:MAG: pseudouridine synthase [Terriglobales bacterium]